MDLNEQMTSQSIKIKRVADKVMKASKNSLIVHMRFLDSAINKLKLEVSEDYVSVDGRAIMYNPLYILRLYKKDKNLVTRTYLHMILHCTFLHFYVGPQINQNLWDIACDIAVENILQQLAATEEYLQTEPEPEREEALEKIREKVDKLTAEKIYRWLLDSEMSEEEMEHLWQIFTYDDHSCWYDMIHKPQELTKDDMKNDKDDKPMMEDPSGEPEEDGEPEPDDDAESEEDERMQEDESTNKEEGQDGRNADEEEREEMGDDGNQEVSKDMEELMEEWEDVAKHMDLDLETFSKEAGSRVGDLLLNLRNVTREKYDYTTFLKKFASMGEKMMIDDDEFDYIYYTYGLTLYDNMPLVEPLEYKETNVVKEFVIAIDTSFSVHGEEVEAFLRKTYNILKATESFSSRINLHIIQCDVKVQHDEKITSQAELDRYMADMLLYGFGGTDFRPVFEYVDELIANKEFTNLKGLIYFTDGFGEFPQRAPAYKTAFAFISDDPMFDPVVPPWAIKLILDPHDIKEDE
ncbi:MAG: metallopeptidase [Oscillospiraceae bacterium]|nr:metallopeptidase [Oscillospiraceae bacterium]